MGRPKNEFVWRHYRETVNKSVICKYCEKQYKISNVNKMGVHLLNCAQCPTTIKKDLQKILSDRNDKQLPLPSPSRNSNASTSEENHTLYENVQASSLPLPSENKAALTSKLVKAIVVSGSPLSMVEHPLWIDFFKELAPSFKLPTRKAVSTTQLDKLYNDMKKEVIEDLNSVAYLHLQLDGWSNRRNEGIINFLISKPEPYFVESLNTEDNRHTGEYISEEIVKVMKTYGEMKFTVLIGDNAKNIQKAFRIVKVTYPQVIPLNCAAHSLNLLCYDSMKPEVITKFIDLAKDVIKTIKKCQILNSTLCKIVKEKKAGETLKLPSKTRWGSHLSALKSLKNTKAALQSLTVHENVQMQFETKTTLLDEDFWNMLEQCITILEPISEPIFKLEANDCKISDVLMVFKNLRSQLDFVLPNISMISDEDKARILAAVEKRTVETVKSVHYAAYLLDPKTQGIELSQDQEVEAMEFITDMAQTLDIDVMLDLANYKAREGFWGKRFVWIGIEEINPVVWWKGVCGSTKLSKIAVRILTAPSTSAAVERSFSTHGNIHSNKRNRLTTERAAKIAFTSYNWNLLHKYQNIEELTDDDTSTPAMMTPVLQSESENEELLDHNLAGPSFVFMDCDGTRVESDDDED